MSALWLALAPGCGGSGGGDEGVSFTTATESATGITGATTGTGEVVTTGGGGSSEVGGETGGSGSSETGGSTGAVGSTGSTGPGGTESTGVGEAGEPSEYVMFSDPLIDGTRGTAIGGSFGPSGWTVTGVADRVFWEVPRLTEGSVEFTISGVTLANLPLNDHEVFAMYEGGYDIEHPIGYNPEFRNNAFKSMIRIYGTAEVGREGQQKIMWGICPFGAPGYHGGECPCTSPAGFFDEPFGGDGAWDGSPQRLRVEWKDGVTRYSRNGGEVLAIDWSGSGLSFGPDSLYVSLGNPRPEEVDSAGMPIGAVFSDLVVEGWTGPVSATCG